jgi:hypothetical protein
VVRAPIRLAADSPFDCWIPANDPRYETGHDTVHHITLEVLCAHSTLGPLLLTPFSLSPLWPLHSPPTPLSNRSASTPALRHSPDCPPLPPPSFLTHSPTAPSPPGRPMPPYRFNSPPQITAGRSWSVLDDLEGAYPFVLAERLRRLATGGGGALLRRTGRRGAGAHGGPVALSVESRRARGARGSEEGGGRVEVVHGGKGDDRGRRGEAGWKESSTRHSTQAQRGSLFWRSLVHRAWCCWCAGAAVERPSVGGVGGGRCRSAAARPRAPLTRLDLSSLMSSHHRPTRPNAPPSQPLSRPTPPL